MSKGNENPNDNNGSVQNTTLTHINKLTLRMGSNVTINENYEINSIEFLGLGKVTVPNNNIQVKTIKVGDKEIDTSDAKGISCISRNADTLEISGEYCDNQQERSYLIEHKVEHCNPISTMGNNSDYSSDNV